MKGSHLRLAVTAALFLGWIGWLLYLVIISREPVILSRPQFLVADVWVHADIQADKDQNPGKVTINEIVWSARDVKSEDIQLDSQELPSTQKDGWEGPGSYLIPLTMPKKGKGPCIVTDLPLSPGFYTRGGEKRIYRATPQAMAQVQNLLNEWKK